MIVKIMMLFCRLCVVLFTKKGPEDDPSRDVFRRYTQGSSLSANDRVKFTYIYEDTQQDFVRTLAKGKQRNEKQLLVNFRKLLLLIVTFKK